MKELRISGRESGEHLESPFWKSVLPQPRIKRVSPVNTAPLPQLPQLWLASAE